MVLQNMNNNNIISQTQFESFFQVIGIVADTHNRIRWEINKKLALDYNVVELFIQPDEMKLSAIFAWLLNPESSHGQGAIFLELFVKSCPWIKDWSIDYTQPVNVNTEALTTKLPDNRRIDIVVEGRDWIIGIENKPWADLQNAQLSAYQSELGQRGKSQCHLLFIPGSQQLPEDYNEEHECKLTTLPYRCMFDSSIEQWLVNCCAVCEAQQIRSFLEQLKQYIVNHFPYYQNSDHGKQGD